MWASVAGLLFCWFLLLDFLVGWLEASECVGIRGWLFGWLFFGYTVGWLVLEASECVGIRGPTVHHQPPVFSVLHTVSLRPTKR